MAKYDLLIMSLITMLISEAFVRKMIKGSKKFDFSTGVS